jgi:hypothetical protein
VSSGRDVSDVESLDVGGVPEHAGKLGCVQLQLIFREGEPGQPGDVGNLVFGDGLGHAAIVTSPLDGGANAWPGPGPASASFEACMAKYPFLSEAWVAEARRIYTEAGTAIETPPDVTSVRVNLVVADVPFSQAPVNAHLDTSGGRVTIDTGHLADADVTVSMDYLTARTLFVGGDVQAVMQAFLAGRIRVDGDLSKLLDPKSGIWPGSQPSAFTAGGEPPAGPQAGQNAEAVGPPTSGAGGPSGSAAGQQAIRFQPPIALQLASRLQEITE